MPSASDERETLPIDCRGSDKLNHQKKRKSRTTSTDEDRQHQIRFEAEEDYQFGRPCNSEVFKIDNIFSNFSLNEVGHEKALKKQITNMVTKKKKRFSENSGSTPSGSSQSATHVEETDSNQNVAKETQIQQEGRLLKVNYNRGFHSLTSKETMFIFSSLFLDTKVQESRQTRCSDKAVESIFLYGASFRSN